MNDKYFFGACLILLIVIVSCSFKQKEAPVNPELLSGKYCHSHDRRDSIFIYPDKRYRHTYHRTDGIVYSQINTWRYEPNINDVFFESFLFYNDGENVDTVRYNGSWSSKVFVTEAGQVKLRYSESVYYVKTKEK